MCGRYTLTNPDPARIRARFGLDESAKLEEEPRYNIAPTDPVLAVRRRDDGGREPGRLRWGLVPGRWAERRSGPPLINARAETLQRQPAFAESFRERRCLIPADGFYEWRDDERGKTPIWVSRPDGDLFAFAGRLGGAAGARRLGRPAQLRDRHLRAERADPPDPRPDAGDPRARRTRRDWLDPERRGGRSALAAGPGAARSCSWSARSATRSTTSARTARTCSSRARRSRSCSSERSPRLRRVARARSVPAVVVLAGERDAADRALLLDVPVLVEADHRDRDQEELHRDDEDASAGRAGRREAAGGLSPGLARANQPGAATAAKIARMIASAEATGQDAAVPARDEQREDARRGPPRAAS